MLDDMLRPSRPAKRLHPTTGPDYIPAASDQLRQPKQSPRQEMKTEPRRPGLQWKKLDLHVHTPASKDYVGPEITPDDFVAQALAKGLHGIAITDHNSGEWIDRMLEAARGTQLAVFPGVEITVTGGKHGVHIIALFDRNATTKTIENLLAKLSLTAADYGRLEAISDQGPEAVVAKIHEAGGLAVLAHADSSKGVLADMQGQQRSRVMNSPHLSAVELTDVARTARFCSGNDPEYRRKLAYYRASDNPTPSGGHGHSIDGVGSRYSWFKCDGLSLDSLRQVFHDPDQRIRSDEETETIPPPRYPRLLSLSVSAGFLKDMTFTFHEGLNSIIGGKGVGKSLLVEFVRFALGQPSSIVDLQKDMNGKLAKQLGVGGQVTIRLKLEVDQEVLVTRTYNGTSNPSASVYADSGKTVSGDIAQLFPILAYSQTETIEIAKDNDAQLRLIDSFLDLATIESTILQVDEDLTKSDVAIAEARVAEDKLSKAEEDLATLDSKISAIEVALKSPELDALNALRTKSGCMAKVSQFADGIELAVQDLSAELASHAPPPLPKALSEDNDLKATLDEIKSRSAKLVSAAKKLEKETAAVADLAKKSVGDWDRFVAERRKEYAQFVKEQGGDRPALLARKSALEEQRPALLKNVETLKERIAGLPKLRAARARLIRELDRTTEARHSLRKEKYASLTEASGGRLELHLIKGGQRARYREALTALKTGSRLQDSTIGQICENADPRDLLAMVDNDDAPGLAEKAHINESSATTLINHLNASADIQGLLALEHGEMLQDSPRIRFLKDDGKYYDLADLSIGQKCTALLIIALAEGKRPIIIDQPEDALDITSVYEDVTLQLRKRRHSRQFILTTHNPTVAVAGDSDQFHVLKASATRATLATEGAIDRPVVREAVIQHLEGGPESFALKAKKYGLPSP